MGAEASSLANAEQAGGDPTVGEELDGMDAKAVSTVGGGRRRSSGRSKTHKAPAGRRNKTRKAK